MADTVVSSGLAIRQWDSKFFVDFVRENRFAAYMGTDENAVIQMKQDLTKKKGDSITFALVNSLTQNAIVDCDYLEGNEEALGTRSHMLKIHLYRNPVRICDVSEQKSAISLRDAARAQLKNWAIEHTRTMVIEALGSYRAGDTIYDWKNSAEFDAIAESVKDAWLVDNRDRTLFGAAHVNSVSLDHSTALATVDNTADKLTSNVISLAKRMAQTASPKINPIRTKGDEEWYVLFTGPLPMRDLVNSDSAFLAANREARERGKENPLFRGADFVWDGVIIKSIPELPVVASGVDGAGIDVTASYLVGAQGLGMGLASRWKSVTEEFDYKAKVGVAIEQFYGIEKMGFGTGAGDTDDLKQHGVVTIWTAAVAD